MSKSKLQLIQPTVELADEYRRMVAEFAQAGEDSHQDEREAIEADFAGFIGQLADHDKGIDLPAQMVPYSTYWLVRNSCLIGTSRLRHRVTDQLAQSYGHIGYDVRPTERGKGYATALLSMTLDKARDRGLQRVLITSETDNAASSRVIAKNGGKLADEVISAASGKRIQRYWIELK